MKPLLAALGAYMVATGWAGLLAGNEALVWAAVVFIPFAIVAVLVADAQRTKYRHDQATWVRPPVSHQTRIIDK